MKRNEFNLAKEYYDFLKKHNKIETIEIKNFNLISQEISNDLNDNKLLSNNYEEIAKKNYFKYKIFKSNFLKINNYNKLNKDTKLELNRFSDEVDFESNNLHYDLMNISTFENSYNLWHKGISFISNFINFNLKKLPKRLIWDEKIISKVKNQGVCGSCWAFSSTGVIEANMRLRNHSVSRLSEQELIDCSNENHGCEGGLMHLAFDYCIENKGLTLNKLYPYQGLDGICKCSNSNYSNNYIRAKGSDIKKYKFTIPKSKYDLMKALQKGPICIAMDANSYIFRFYKEGIIDIPFKSRQINHAVILVGYDYNENGTYWLIQNSWGENWGDNGYAKLKIKDGEGTLACQLYGVYINNN
jgi:C1A family cysteine protease